MKSYFWFLCLLLNGCRLWAQPFTSRTLSIQQGLPEYYVTGLVQDKAGFVWIATRDGLARYDGRLFKIFRHQPHTNTSIASNIILSLQRVADSTILIHLENDGFQLLNPVTEQFSALLTKPQLDAHHLNVAGATLTPDGNDFWGRHQAQLIHYRPRQNQLTIYPLPPIPLPKNAFIGNSSVLSAQANLYAPFPGGLLEFNTHRHQFRQFINPAIDHQPVVDTYYGTPIIQRATGDVLIGGARQLIVFNPFSHRFRSISVPNPIETKVGLIHEGIDGSIYFTLAMTLYRMTPDDQITPLWTAPRIDYRNYFHALLLDRSGVLWVGTNGDGVQQIDLRSLPVKVYPYQTNFVADVLSLELDLSTPDWVKAYDIPYRLRTGGAGLYATAWFANAYHLFRLDQARHRLQPRLVIPWPKNHRVLGEGNGMRVLPTGQIWMYDISQGLIRTDTAGRQPTGFPCSIHWVSDIQPLGPWVWISSEFDGLYAYDPSLRRIVRHLRYQPTDPTSICSNHIGCLTADPHDPAVLWIGTQEGLSRLDTRTLRCQNWTEKQGLPSATINTLLTDRRGWIWFSTLKGISRLDPQRRRMRHFSTADGLLDIEYKPYLGARLPDGRLAFGGLNGLTVFDPLALKEALPSDIPTVLTALRIANMAVEPRPVGSPLQRPLNATTTLQLSHTQNFLSLEFAGLQYNKPSSLQYRYQLTGVDADWVYVGNQTAANYTQLAPGHYQFRVNAADAGGRWSRLIKTIRIVIDPPWWQTGWAYGLYGLLIAGLIRAYVQYRINRTELRQEMMLQEQEVRLTRQNADWQTRFFTNITHEFRTPLTLILGPVERLLDSSAPLSRANLSQQGRVIYRSAHRLLRLINQLLDVAKLEAGQLALTESQGNLPAFFAELIDSFQPRVDKKGIRLTYESSGLTANYRFDAQKLESVGYNLLANAVKFTEPGGRIWVRLGEEIVADGSSGLRFQVADTGCGIAPEQLPRIFDRFFQGPSADARAGRGTGIGLFLVAELTRLLGGHVTVESQLGQGTTFTLILPLHPADGSVPIVEPTVVDSTVYTGISPEIPIAPETASLVLVVEDNDELREFIAQELASIYRVLTAVDGEQGWQLCLAELPELVISDVMMPVQPSVGPTGTIQSGTLQSGPEVDGFTLVDRIKITPLTAHIAVILLTAKTKAESRIQGLSMGANDYLTKPFNVRELQLRISNLLRHQQQLRQHWQQQISQLGEQKSAQPVTSFLAEDPFLHKLYVVLDSELANPAFNVEQLADALAVSSRTLHRKVSTLTGSNANEVVRSYRLRKAALFLQEGASVSEAAEKSGFDGLSYFSRSFKAQFAVTPSMYLLTQKNK